MRVHLFFANVKLMERDMVIIQCELGLSASNVALFFYSGQLVEKASDNEDFTKSDFVIVDESDAPMLDSPRAFLEVWRKIRDQIGGGFFLTATSFDYLQENGGSSTEK